MMRGTCGSKCGDKGGGGEAVRYEESAENDREQVFGACLGTKQIL